MQRKSELTAGNWPINKVRPYEGNPRIIPQSAVEKVAASIWAFGWQQPIVVDRDGVIIVGHPRSVGSKYGRHDMAWLRENVDARAQMIKGLVRHKYLMPLDDDMRARVEPLAKTYPKRAKQATAGHHSDGGGAAPTRALQPMAGDT